LPDVRICVLPHQFDPDELLKESDGLARFKAAIAGSVDALQYKINRFQSQLDGAIGISARQKRLESFLLELSNLGFGSMQGVRKSMVMSQLGQMLSVSVGAIESAMPKARKAVTPRGPSGSPDWDERSALAAVPREALAAEHDGVSPARRRAERDLLALLVYQPELGSTTVDLEGERPGRIADLIEVTHFTDPLASRIATAVFPRLTQGETFTVQQVLAELSQPEAKSLTTALFFEGQRLCEGGATDSGEPVTVLRSAAVALRAHISLEQYQRTVSNYRQCKEAPQEALLAAQTVIEQRRRQEKIAWAIARGVRS
jgi:hypothetical protein